ncbi:MAG: UDP-N-acetylmuramate dehydrogenase [Mariprofundaceae bacterium]
MSGWTQQLAALGELRADEPMARHLTLGVGGPARWFFRPRDREALVEAMRRLAESTEAPDILPLGRGSNLLVADAGFDGLVIDMGALDAIAFGETGHGRPEVRAEAGARMSRLAQRCAERGLAGLEFMATVPGDVGGGVAMNAGAFDQQVSDTLREVTVIAGAAVERLPAGALDMGYRHTRLPHGALVIEAVFEPVPDDPDAVRARIREMRARRGRTQPLDQPNCGSVFKNPPGDHAARLIEAAGLKGRRIGHARISERHANFIVNEGHATAADVLALIRLARDAVAERFGVRLEPEVRIVGARP